jgi:WD40 repeat protein
MVSAYSLADQQLLLEQWDRTQFGAVRDKDVLNFTVDEKLVALGRNGQVVLTKIPGRLVLRDQDKTGSQEVEVDIADDALVALSRDGRAIAVASGSQLRLVAAADGKDLAILNRVGEPLQQLALSRDGKVLAGVVNGCVSLWRAQAGAASGQGVESTSALIELVPIHKAQSGKSSCVHDDQISSVAVANSGEQVALGATDGDLHQLYIKGLYASRAIKNKAHNGAVSLVAFRPPNGDAVMTAGNRNLRLYNTDGKILAEYEGHRGRIADFDFSEDGHFAVSLGAAESVRVWATHWQEWIKIGCRRLSHHSSASSSGDAGQADQKQQALATQSDCKFWLSSGKEGRVVGVKLSG